MTTISCWFKICFVSIEKHEDDIYSNFISFSIAFQLFSQSTFTAMKSYWLQETAGDWTTRKGQLASQFLNELFNSHGSRRPVEAIKTTGHLLVLEKAKLWLDAWEAHIVDLPKKDIFFFLSKPTATARRLSLQSVIDLPSTHTP